jgi:Spy/CpxP family protein refolding chaperone
MMQTLSRRLLNLLLFVALAAPASARQSPTQPNQPFREPTPQPFAWWRSEALKKELALSADQITRIDKIWETTRVELHQEKDELEKLEAKFSRLLRSNADEALLSRQIDRVEMARANANKTRSLMLVQMRKVLTPEQRTRLDELHAQWLQDARSVPLGARPQTKDDPKDQSKKAERKSQEP